MRYATVCYNGHQRVGIYDPQSDQVFLAEDATGRPLTDLLSFIKAGGGSARKSEDQRPFKRSEVQLLAPIPRPARNILCVGKNYHEHAHEFAQSGFDSSSRSAADVVPDFPIIFTKAPECVIANGDAIHYPAGVSDSVDYEAELGVVIGQGGKGIARADAYKHIFGYTIINDVTARDLQGRHKQWFLGKSLDTFCPMGPYIVTADEVDPENLTVRCWVNDELRQDANTKDLIFDIPTLIETISAGITLNPGDVIATGTPAGVGIGFKPPKFLKIGDRVSIEIGNLGRLENALA